MNIKAHTLKMPFWHKISTKMLFFGIISLFVFLSIFYVYLVNKTIMNVIARSNTEKQIASISSVMSEMETQYITLENNITLDVAYARGFKDVTPQQFVSTDQSLTYNYR